MALGFLTNSEAKEKISGLESRIADLEADATSRDEALSAAQAELATATESLSEANAQLTGAREQITALEATVATNAAEISRLTEEAKHTKEKVSLEASRIVAASGHQAPVDNPDAGGEQAQTKTRAEFKAMSPVARGQFLKAGGKLTD